MDDTPPRRKRGRPRKSESQPGRGVQLRGLEYRRNQDGTVRTYVRPRGSTRAIRLPDAPENSPEFLAAYAAAVAAANARSPEVKTSLRSMADGYYRSREWQELAPSSQVQRRRELERLVSKAPDEAIAMVEAKHVRGDIAKLTPGAASNRLRAWRALLSHAENMGVVDRNVARDVKPPKQLGGGHRPWTAVEIGQFRAAHSSGTEARLAMELTYWTGARRSDVRLFGGEALGNDGWLAYTQVKTGIAVEVPLLNLPAGCGELAEDHRHVLAALEHAMERRWWLQNRHGQPRSENAIGMWFQQYVADAGLPSGCVMHGLRGARASRLAEYGWPEFRIGAWTGHKTLREIVHYSRGARRRVLVAGRNSNEDVD